MYNHIFSLHADNPEILKYIYFLQQLVNYFYSWDETTYHWSESCKPTLKIRNKCTATEIKALESCKGTGGNNNYRVHSLKEN